MKRIFITGALGQIGTELTLYLRQIYGPNNVLATDIIQNNSEVVHSGPFEKIDVTDKKALGETALQFNCDTIIHLAALLSAKAEQNPMRAWNLNMGGLLNTLETAKELNATFFTPSSIGAFGPTTPKHNTPQLTIQRPVTMYGVNKVTGELLSDYYFYKYGLDSRGLRFPGLISHVAPPGGGTTDYAVKIFYDAIQKSSYTSYLKSDTYLDMMYMPDALQAIVDLMEADPAKLIHRNAYNVSAMSFSPKELAAEIKKYISTFTINYQIDPIRQQIADSWPNSIDSSLASKEWGFHVQYNLNKMVKDMIKQLKKKI